VTAVDQTMLAEFTAEADRLIEFSRASRHPGGGFAWLGGDGRPVLDRPVETWITCRMTHVFALGALMGRADCEPLVAHGVEALQTILRDTEHGGWFAAADRPGLGEKRAYDQAFVLLAASSAKAAGAMDADELLNDATAIFNRRFWDEEHGRVTDVWSRDWGVCENYRGANANMHTFEAALAVADVTGDDRWRTRALRIATWFIDDQARNHDWRIPEHFSPAWVPQPEYNRADPAHKFRPYGATPGHAFEWSRLVLQLRASLGQDAPAWLLPAATALVDRAVADGWDGCGFVYTTDWNGAPVVRSRLHWVLCEAIAASAALIHATGDARYEGQLGDWWQVAKRHFIDTERGSWRHELDENNQLNESVWPGKPDTYHAVQAMLVPRLPLGASFATGLRQQRLGPD
jgi:sulfoquinovose isomerase